MKMQVAEMSKMVSATATAQRTPSAEQELQPRCNGSAQPPPTEGAVLFCRYLIDMQSRNSIK